MLSVETESSVTRLLLNLADGERQIEISRQVLAQNLDFDPYQVFCVIDKEGKNSIDAVNIVEFMKQNSKLASIQDAEFFIMFYDSDCDRLLSYSEFLNVVLSETNYSLRQLARDRAGLTVPKLMLTFNAEYSIAKIIEKELDIVRSTRGMIEMIRERYDFSPHDIYHLLKGYGAITQESLRNFFNRNTVNASFDDIKSIMKRLDFNKDGRVDFKEFHCLLTFPQCNHCNCYHHCCCSIISSSIQNNTYNDVLSIKSQSGSQSSLNNNNSVTYQKNSLEPERNNRFIPSTQKQETLRVSHNLSLRSSPERKFSPRNTLNKQENSVKASSINYNNSPNRSNQMLSNSPNHNHNHHHHHHHISPIRCNINQCHTNCHICNCSPCSCCQIAYEKGERLFLNYIKEMMTSEMKIEQSKIGLALRADFNVEDAFRIFEVNGRGYITESDLKYGLSQLDVFASQSDLKLLMRRVDLHKTGTITYGTFFDLVTPFDRDYRAMIEKRSQSCYSSPYNKADVFLLGTKITLQNLLKVIIGLENKLETMKCGMREAREQLKNIFTVISRGCCTFSDIDMASYLRTKDIFVTDKESGLGFIRLDKNRTGKVELWTMADELNTTV